MRFLDLLEGPNDPNIFKAIFLAGGPGSGKSYVASTILSLPSKGFRVINSDDALEYLMKKHDLDLTMPAQQQAQRDLVRTRAKQITSKKQQLYLDGRLGLLIDGTAKDVNKMAKLKSELESIGYQTAMLFVNTNLRTALQRNVQRPRQVPSDLVIKSHEEVQNNKTLLQNLFGDNYYEVDNNEGVTNFDPPQKFINRFLQQPLTAQARDWISKARLQQSLNEQTENKPKVYVDMDGVIAHFYAGITAHTGHAEPRELAFQDMEDAMASLKGTDFFYTLPKYDQTDQLIAMVNAATDGEWYILSSPLKYDREGSAKHKAAWVRDKLKIQPKGMHFTGDKAQFATQPDGTPNILIDDYPEYLKKWTAAGGIGVKYKGHVGNIQDVKATLDQYFADSVQETIRKVKGGWRLYSKDGKKNLGTYPTRAGAVQREREVQYFKRHSESVINEEITQNHLAEIERYADRLFGTLGIDVNFTKHFLDRVNDARNVKPITASELTRLFKQVYKRWGKPIAQLGPDSEAVMKDMQTDINMPFLLVWDNDSKELDLIAKTVMRKQKFFTPDPVFAVEQEVNGNFADDKVKGKITLSTNPNWYGAEVGDYKASGPIVNISAAKLVGFEPDEKMSQPSSKANVEKIVAGLKKGDKLPPILVRKYKDGYQVVDGHHRFWAYKLLGIKSIPSQIVPDEDIIVKENFADGRVKGKSRPGRVKRAGASCKGTVISLRKKAKDSGGEKAKMYHWCANMKSGRDKKK